MPVRDFAEIVAAAQESLQFKLFLSGKNGSLYFIDCKRYTKCDSTDNGLQMSNSNLQGTEYVHGIKNFIDSALDEPDCIGIVPLTAEAKIFLTGSYHLKPAIEGMTLEPENLSFSAYRR